MCIRDSVYTGRMLWERELKDVGEYYNTTRHFAGAGEVGSNYVTLADAVYVVYRTKILELDIETGSTKKEFSLQDNPNFGWLSVQGDYLVATVSPKNTASFTITSPPACFAPHRCPPR